MIDFFETMERLQKAPIVDISDASLRRLTLINVARLPNLSEDKRYQFVAGSTAPGEFIYRDNVSKVSWDGYFRRPIDSLSTFVDAESLKDIGRHFPHHIILSDNLGLSTDATVKEKANALESLAYMGTVLRRQRIGFCVPMSQGYGSRATLSQLLGYCVQNETHQLDPLTEAVAGQK